MYNEKMNYYKTNMENCEKNTFCNGFWPLGKWVCDCSLLCFAFIEEDKSQKGFVDRIGRKEFRIASVVLLFSLYQYPNNNILK